MKRVVIGLLIFILMIGSVLAGANTINFNLELKENNALFEIEDGEISITIPIGDYEIIKSNQGCEVTVEDFGRHLIPGKPNLPSKIFSIAIPPGAIFVDFSFDSREKIILDGSYNVIPVDLPRVIGQEDPEIYKQEQMTYKENYESVYGNDDPYPSSNVEFIRTAGFRKYNLADVRVNPFTYYPLSGQLVYHPEVDVFVSYEFPEGCSPDNVMIDNIPDMEKRAERIILNYNQAKTWYPTGPLGRDTYDFVIITTDSLQSYVQDLKSWEEVKGRSVNVVTTSWISSNYDGYDLAEKMRNCAACEFFKTVKTEEGDDFKA